MKLIIIFILPLLNTYSSQKLIVNQKYSAWIQKNNQIIQKFNETKHQKSFIENSEIIEKHNKQAADFELDYNEFSYLNKKEFVKLYCKTKMPKKFLPDRPMLSRVKTFNNFTLKNLPESFSWQDYLRPVKKQGKCGSCFAFSVTSMLEAINKRKDNKWNNELSPQYIVDCDRQSSGCAGGWPTDSLKFLKIQSQNEAPTLSNYPYTGVQEKCRMIGFPKVKLNIDEIFEFKLKGNEKQIKLHLVNYGPLVIAMFVNDDSGLFQNYKRGIFYEQGCPNNCKKVNHAMVMVGYGVTNDSAKKPYYLILNSWGESWGENGYMRFAADRGNNCNIACFGMVIN